MKFLRYFLIPFSAIYLVITQFRNFLFDFGIIKPFQSKIPVLVIGNLSTGGTGKTPHSIFFIKNLSNEKNIAILSRGYGRSSKGLRIVEFNGNPDEYGDEPLEIKDKFPSIVVVVSDSRKQGIKCIEKKFPQTNLIIMDDGYQHRWIKPTYSILLTKYSCPYSSDYILPFGNLRESSINCKRANAIIVSKVPEKKLEILQSDWSKRLKIKSTQLLFFSKIEYCNILFSINSKKQLKIEELKNYTVLLLTGLASSKELHLFLEGIGTKIIEWRFSDHYKYTENDIIKLEKFVKDQKALDLAVVTTSKDVIKLNKIEKISKLSFDIFEIQSNVCIIGEQNKLELLNQIKKIC
jgi:tetraacyldisaccharide 4'-kinase